MVKRVILFIQTDIDFIFIIVGVPVAPTNVTITNVTSRSISLQWDVLDNGNAYITGSIVQYQTHSGTFNII